MSMFARCMCLAGILAMPGIATADAPTTQTVRQMLSGFEDMPNRNQWLALGPETAQVLVALYNDTSQPGYIRIRTLSAVAHFPSDATRTFLKAVASAPNQIDLYVREAVLSMARALGARALNDIRPYLTHRQMTVREGAAMALGKIGNASARRILTEHRAVETNRTVRQTIDRVLSQPVSEPPRTTR